MNERDAILAEAAHFYYTAAELYEDEDLDPDDHLEVLKRAFASSDCDAFASVLARKTGWDTVRFSWTIPDWGFGHHTLVKSPDGRHLDVTGWTSAQQLSKRYGAKKHGYSITEAPPFEAEPGEVDDDGFDVDLKRIAAVIANLPYAPFDQAEFRLLCAEHELEGADFPIPQDQPEP